MKLIMENWRNYLNEAEVRDKFDDEVERDNKKRSKKARKAMGLEEEVWADYGHDKGKWEEIPTSDMSNDPDNVDITDELIALINNAYKNIGGNYDFQTADDIPGEADYWTAIDIDDDPEPDAVRVAKSKPSGLKMSAAGHDGSRPAIDAYKKKTADMLLTPGTYAEMSKGIAHVMLKYHNVPYVDDPEVVQKTLGASKPIKWLGQHPEGKYPGIDGWYTRTISGHADELKIMLGSPR